MVDVLKAGASAVAAAAMFHYTESTPLEAKRFLGRERHPGAVIGSV